MAAPLGPSEIGVDVLLPERSGVTLVVAGLGPYPGLIPSRSRTLAIVTVDQKGDYQEGENDTRGAEDNVHNQTVPQVLDPSYVLHLSDIQIAANVLNGKYGRRSKNDCYRTGQGGGCNSNTAHR